MLNNKLFIYKSRVQTTQKNKLISLKKNYNSANKSSLSALTLGISNRRPATSGKRDNNAVARVFAGCGGFPAQARARVGISDVCWSCPSIGRRRLTYRMNGVARSRKRSFPTRGEGVPACDDVGRTRGGVKAGDQPPAAVSSPIYKSLAGLSRSQAI